MFWFYQGKEYQTVDSLKELRCSEDNTIRGKALNNIARYLYHRDNKEFTFDDFGLPEGVDTILELFKNAADLGDWCATMNLGIYYLRCGDVTQDINTSIDWFLMAINRAGTNQGKALSFFGLACAYEKNGQATEALDCAAKAFQVDRTNLKEEKDFRYFQRKLGEQMLQNNQLNELDRANTAIRQYDYKPAHEYIGDLFFNGKNVTTEHYNQYSDRVQKTFWSYQKAYDSYSKARDAGVQSAADKMNAMDIIRQQDPRHCERETRDSLKLKLQSFLGEIGQFYVEKLGICRSWRNTIDYYVLLGNEACLQEAAEHLKDVPVELSDEKKWRQKVRTATPEQLQASLEEYIEKIRRACAEARQNGDQRLVRNLRSILEALEKLRTRLEIGQVGQEELKQLIDAVFAAFREAEWPMPGALRDLFGAIKHSCCRYPILGEYDYRRNCIVLYIQSIKEYLTDNWTFEAKVLNVLAHEAFHAFHYRCIQQNGQTWWDKRDSYREIVIESLAAYAEYLFCCEKESNMVPNIDEIQSEYDKAWKQESVLYWPYAGARYYQWRPDDLFKKEFWLSLQNYSEAKKLLETCKNAEDMGYRIS